MQRLDYWSVLEPALGINTLVPLLKSEGLNISRELCRELRAQMGLETIYPKSKKEAVNMLQIRESCPICSEN
jgi:hypothetical protein